MRLNTKPTLRIRGRYFTDKAMWREMSAVLGTDITNADALYDVLTDPFEFFDDLTIEWHLPKTPLTVHEHKLLDALLQVSLDRDDLTLEFPNPPRWLSAMGKLG